MFAAPKMPNLIASSRLAGLGGMKADMTRLMSAAISSVYTAYQYRWFIRGAFGFGAALTVRSFGWCDVKWTVHMLQARCAWRVFRLVQSVVAGVECVE